MRTSPHEPLFAALAGLDRENSLSRSFKACFDHSLAFKSAVLQAIFGACDISGMPASPSSWTCTYQPSTPYKGGGRPDLRLALPEQRLEIFLESKLDARLTLTQLLKYKRNGTRYLVAITKNPPEVPPRDMTTHGINSLRWRDIHRCLASTTAHNPVDRFLFQQFTQYLEVQGMAHLGTVTLSDLEQVGKLLSRVSSNSDEEFVRGSNSFDAAARCFALLEDLYESFVERNRRFDAAARWGPGYLKYVDEGVATKHDFGWDIYPRTLSGGQTGDLWYHRHFCVRLRFPQSEPYRPKLYLKYLKSKASNPQISTLSVSQFCREGVLDPHLMLKHVEHCLTKWQIKI